MEGINNDSHPIIRLLLQGCDLAKKLESDLSSSSIWAASSPLVLSHKCDEIINIFTLTKQQLTIALHPLPLDRHHHHHQQQQQQPYHPKLASVFENAIYQANKGKGKEVTGDIAELSTKANSGDGEQQQLTTMMIDVGGSSSSAPRNPRRSSRYDDQGSNIRRERAAASQIGNTEMPPADGFSWRKYGQKPILNSKYTRSYYRCTHQKLYNCPARKQVQRLDDDPNTFDILYLKEHTCHLSNTAPSGPPPASQAVQDIFLPQSPIATVDSPLCHWLSRDFIIPSFEGACTILDPQQRVQLHRENSSSSILCANADAEPSTIRSHQGGDRAVDMLISQPMVDWTEMLNSGSNSSNSMEVIFAPTYSMINGTTIEDINLR